MGRSGEQVHPTAGELEIVRQAARCTDEADKWERELRKQPALILGSMGHLRPNPLIKVLQDHRVLIRRLMDSLNIPDEEEEVGMTGRQRHAQRAAQGRWARREVS